MEHNAPTPMVEVRALRFIAKKLQHLSRRVPDMNLRAMLHEDGIKIQAVFFINKKRVYTDAVFRFDAFPAYDIRGGFDAFLKKLLDTLGEKARKSRIEGNSILELTKHAIDETPKG